MKLRSTLLASAFGLSLALAAGQAHAILFQGNFAVTAHSSGDGLLIETAPNVAAGHSTGGSGFEFNLTNIGDSVSFRLFDIWTNETDVAWGEDDVAKDISVSFSFSAPPPPFGGSVDGTTVGGNFFIAQSGYVTWNGPEFVDFGPLGDGVLRISLEDEEFNYGSIFTDGFHYNGLNEGEAYGANVKVKFKLVDDPTVPVPEPATLALLGAGLLGLGAIRRRKVA